MKFKTIRSYLQINPTNNYFNTLNLYKLRAPCNRSGSCGSSNCRSEAEVGVGVHLVREGLHQRLRGLLSHAPIQNCRASCGAHCQQHLRALQR